MTHIENRMCVYTCIHDKIRAFMCLVISSLLFRKEIYCVCIHVLDHSNNKMIEKKLE